MDYNLAAIRQRVLVDKLDDEEFDPGVVDRFINDTQREIFNTYELPFMEKIFSGTVPATVTMFNFPDDVAMLQQMTVTSPDLSQRSIMDSEMKFRDFTALYPTPLNNAPGPISRFALYASRMLVSQPTDQEYELTIMYIRKPQKLVEDTDVPELPEEFSELLVLGAFMRVQKRNEDFDLADETQKEIDKHLNLLTQRYGFRKQGPMVLGNANQRPVRTRGAFVRKSY